LTDENKDESIVATHKAKIYVDGAVVESSVSSNVKMNMISHYKRYLETENKQPSTYVLSTSPRRDIVVDWSRVGALFFEAS